MRTAVCLALGSLLAVADAAAEAPPLVNFQGKLTTPAGTPVPDSVYDVRFRIYSAETGGDGLSCTAPCLWEESQSITTQYGVYSALLGSIQPLTAGVFDGAARFLGIRIGSGAEMSPRQRIASVPYALMAQSVGLSARHGYDCGLDWNESGAFDAADVLLCLNAAREFVTTHEDGTDNAVDILLPDGNIVLCDSALPGGNPCPYTLEPGMNLHGVAPRLLRVGEEAQDLDMRPNGGTWIDGNQQNSANGIFVGDDLRGLTIEDIGFHNYTVGLDFGSVGNPGLSFATLRNLYFVGIPNSGTTTALHLTNYQHVYGEHLSAFRCSHCFRFEQAHNARQYGNSVWNDLYVYTYKSGFTYGLALECNFQPGGPANDGNLLNYNVFVRPQINSFIATAGNNLFFDGEHNCWVNLPTVIAADIEGDTLSSIKLRYVIGADLSFSGVGRRLDIDITTQNSVLRSAGKTVVVGDLHGTTMLIGDFTGEPESTRGLYFDSKHTWLGADRVFSQAAFQGTDALTTLTEAWSLNSSFQSASVAIDGPDFTGLAVRPSNFFDTINAHSNFFGVHTRLHFFGAGSDNQSGDNAAFYADALVAPTGSGNTLADVAGFWSALGDGWSGTTTVNRFDLFRADAVSPAAIGTTTLGALAGLHVYDLSGTGSANHAVVVDVQSGASSAKGNLELAGDDHDEGHLVQGGGHLWPSGPGSDWRWKGGAPVSASDGSALVRGECGSVTVDPPSIPALSTGTASATVSNTSGANLRCSCYPQIDFADDLIEKGCGFNGLGLILRLYNASNAAVDAPARTLSYCCFEN